MRIRTVITGILTAILCIIVLRFQFYRVELSKIVPGLPNQSFASSLSGWVDGAVLIYCCIMLLVGGWVAARWNWSNSWQRSLQTGGAMGFLAGCLIYDFIGAFWYGVKGQADILGSYYLTITEAEGTRIVAQSMVKTGSDLYGYFILTIFCCTFLGAFGGFFSAIIDRKDYWGKNPRNPEGWLFRSTAYLLSIVGYFNIIVALAVLSTLRPRILNTASTFAEKYGGSLDIEPAFTLFHVFSTFTIWSFTFLPVGITWGWIIRKYIAQKNIKRSSKIWLVFSSVGLLSFTWFLSPTVFTSVIDIACILVTFCIGMGTSLFNRDQSEGFSYHLSDWVGYGLTYGILGGTQIVMGVVAYSISTALIAIVNIPHLVASREVEQSPIEQVLRLFNFMNTVSWIAIISSIAFGLIVISIVSFLRTAWGISDLPANQ